MEQQTAYTYLTEHLSDCEICPGTTALLPETTSDRLCDQGIILREAWRDQVRTEKAGAQERIRAAHHGILRSVMITARVRGARPDKARLEKAAHSALKALGFKVESVTASFGELTERQGIHTG